MYVGVTEHGNVETENEIHELKNYNYDTSFWSHHHNPRTVANNPAGEVALNMGITGPHYTIGAACAAGNAGLIQGAQMLRLNECDLAICGGVSESIHTFGIFASFHSQGALAQHADPSRASRPFDMQRNGIVVAEGGCVFIAERLDDAKRRGARIYGELAGYAMNTDATDFVLPNPERQAECMELALKRAGLVAEQIDIVSTHATGTASGDSQECIALRRVFGGSKKTFFNNTKSFIGHSMGAAGALELAGNFGAFEDGVCHATINVDELDPECALDGLVLNQPREIGKATYILNNSFGMLGINSVAIIKRYLRRHAQIRLRSIRGMTPAEIRTEIISILEDIAPDEDLTNLQDDVPFREQMELDSMDFLDIVMELRKRHRVQIPEEEYKQLASMASTVKYLEPLMKDM